MTDFGMGGQPECWRAPSPVFKAIQAGKPVFARIYTKYLTENVELKGRIALKFNIQPTGQVEKAMIVSSNTGDTAMDEEMLASIPRFEPVDSKCLVTVEFAILLDRH